MKIICAAIRINTQIFLGNNHSEIGLKMVEGGYCKAPYPGGENQGFFTDTGIFVRRESALMIAIRAGQVKSGETIHSKKLFSEDIKWDHTPFTIKENKDGILEIII